MDTDTTTKLRTAALGYATRGWPVFPVRPYAKKEPIIKQWETRASTDPEQIQHWWRNTPYSIGIATGPAGLVAIDLDTPKPGEPIPEPWASHGITSGTGVLAALAKNAGTVVTPTYTVRTPTGGWHLYYTTPPDTHLRNTGPANAIGWKIDTRAHGGYIIAAGSPVPPHGYQLIDNRHPAELPTWLHHALTAKPSPGLSTAPVTAPTNPQGYVAAALRGECHRVRNTPPGQHNAALCRAAYSLGQLAGAGLLDETTARRALTTAAETMISADCDCTPREITRVITTSLTAGATNPRRTTPRTNYRRAA